MTNPSTPKKLNFAQLSLMAWFSEKPAERVLLDYGGIHGGRLYREFDSTGEVAHWPSLDTIRLPSFVPDRHERDLSIKEFFGGGNPHFSTSALYDAGLLVRETHHTAKAYNQDDASELQKNLHSRAPMKFKWDTCVEGISDLGLKWWHEQGHGMYLSAIEKRLKAQKSTSRKVLIGSLCSVKAEPSPEQRTQTEGLWNFPVPSRQFARPIAVATVVKEGPQRIYLSDIELVNAPGVSHLSVKEWPIQGNHPDRYTSKENILIDNFDPSRLPDLMKVDAEVYQDIRDLHRRAIDELIPIIMRLQGQTKQMEAMHAGMLQEALERASAPVVNEEESQPAPKP